MRKRVTCHLMLAFPVSPQAIEYSRRYVSNWQVARVQTGREFIAQEHLRQRGVELIIPTHSVLQRFPDRKPITIQKPLFGGYGMLSISIYQRHDVLTAPWIIDILKHELPDEDMERIRNLSLIPSAEPWNEIAIGKRVRVAGGPLTGAEGILVRKKGHSRFVLRVEQMAGSVSVEIDGWDVEKA